MNDHLLDAIPFDPAPDELYGRLRLKSGSSRAAEFLRLLDEARALARPRAFYRLSSITRRGDAWVEVDGVRFSSRVLRVNLDPIYRVFPYLVTCGQELQQWVAGMDDMLLSFWGEAIKEAALMAARQALSVHLRRVYQVGHVASMNPGSLEDWPIQEQRVLFGLFGPYAGRAGVQLNESLLMLPTKSVSGILFESEADFESCQLCQREDCPGRRAEYDPAMFEQRYDMPAHR